MSYIQKNRRKWWRGPYRAIVRTVEKPKWAMYQLLGKERPERRRQRRHNDQSNQELTWRNMS